MRHSNFRTLILFLLLICLSVTLIACRYYQQEPIVFVPIEGEETVPPEPEVPAADASAENTIVSSEPAAAVPQQTESTSPAAPEETVDTSGVSMADALFIGDSRTAGLRDYAPLEGADYFAFEGMSVYNIHKLSLAVPSVGTVTLEQLLESKKYGKIYVMLGINEAGYDLDETDASYGKLVSWLREKQPEAEIYLQANLHVSRRQSSHDEVFNNNTINRINSRVAQIAEKQNAVYLDVNSLFDDAKGNLPSRITGDEVHLLARYYDKWSHWILEQTALSGKEHDL